MRQAQQQADGSWQTDVVIVGSGIVGAMMADLIAAQGHAVLLIDAGPRLERGQIVENSRNMQAYNRLESDYQSLYPQSEFATAPIYIPPNNYLKLSGPNAAAYEQSYLKAVGGTTWHWAASCWRHLPVDLEMKTAYGVGRNWAVSYEELEPYYCRAEEEIGVAGPTDPNWQSPSERSKPYPMEMVPWSYIDRTVAETVNPHGYKLVPIPQGRSTRVWQGRPVCSGNNNCMPICPIGAMYNGIHHVERAKNKGVIVLSESVVYKVDTNATNNRINAIHFYNNQGQSFKVQAKRFVFACNGIETPRLLLLAANAQNPNGIANSSDQVGRNMMDHSGFHGTFLPEKPTWGGRGPAQSSAMVAFRDGAFRSEHSAYLIITSNQTLAQMTTVNALKNQYIGDELNAEIRRRNSHTFILGVMLEVLPDPNNRLTLSKTRKDKHGLACPDIYYDVGDYVRRGQAAANIQLKKISDLFNCSEFSLSTVLNANNHIMGGTIMGTSPKDSVVNGFCRSYDHENLWLPGGGAIPSSSVVNSTLSMAALGIRAADDILKSLRSKP